MLQILIDGCHVCIQRIPYYYKAIILGVAAGQSMGLYLAYESNNNNIVIACTCAFVLF